MSALVHQDLLQGEFDEVFMVVISRFGHDEIGEQCDECFIGAGRMLGVSVIIQKSDCYTVPDDLGMLDATIRCSR